jgi:hypothetical protein
MAYRRAMYQESLQRFLELQLQAAGRMLVLSRSNANPASAERSLEKSRIAICSFHRFITKMEDGGEFARLRTQADALEAEIYRLSNTEHRPIP